MSDMSKKPAKPKPSKPGGKCKTVQFLKFAALETHKRICPICRKTPELN